MAKRAWYFSGALMAATGAAQAQSTVTIFGKIDEALTYARSSDGTTGINGTGTPVAGARYKRLDANVGAGGSRLGFKFEEDLGGGLKALGLMEHGFNADTGVTGLGGIMWGRQIYVGLAGNDWFLTLGRHYSPMNVMNAAVDPLAGNFWGHAVSQLSGIGVSQNGTTLGSTPGSSGALARVDNSVVGSKTIGPIKAQLMLSAGNETPGGAGRVIDPAIYYTSGPLLLAGNWVRYRQAVDIAAAPAQPKWQTMWLVGGSYDFTSFKVFAGYSRVVRSSNASYVAASQTPWDSLDGYWTGFKLPFGASVLSVSLGGNTYHNRMSAANPSGRNGQARQLGVTYEYFLSKRTELYVSSGMRNNDAFSKSGFIAVIQAAAPEQGYNTDYRALSFGITHSF